VRRTEGTNRPQGWPSLSANQTRTDWNSERAGVEFHIRCDPVDISRYVFTPGDHARARRFADAFTEPYLVTDSRGYLPLSFPAVPTFEVTRWLIDAARELNIPVYVALGASGDAFYAPREPRERELEIPTCGP
jgi:uridine phosphorylase